VTTLAVIAALGALEEQVHPELVLLGIPPQLLLMVTMAVAAIVWLLLVYLTKDKTPGAPSQETMNSAGTEPQKSPSPSSISNGSNIGEPDGVC
jgi:hypothetical protein